MLERKRDKIDRMEKEMKWVREDAEAFVLLSLHVPALSLALRSGRRISQPARTGSSTLLVVIGQRRRGGVRGGRLSWGRRTLRCASAFRNLKGLKSLVDDDPQWEDIETPDSNGHC